MLQSHLSKAINLLLVITALLFIPHLSGCNGSSSESDTQAETDTTLRVVSTPNPSLFPFLLALDSNPDLKATLVPVSGSKTINSAFQENKGDALLSMTYVAAKKSISESIEEMRLHSVNYWRGFQTLSYTEENISDMGDLVGKNYLISGPVGTGENGGPDIFFKAAARIAGFNSDNFNMHYQSLNDGVETFSTQAKMDDNQLVAGYLLVEPAATGMIMQGQSQDLSIHRSVDMQKLINDNRSYTAWESTELPLGGLSIAVRVDDDPAYKDSITALTQAYNQGAKDLMDAKGNMQTLREYAQIISDGITEHYAEYGIAIPMPVIMGAIQNGELIYKNNIENSTIQQDLDSFIEDVLEQEIDDSFYK